METISYINLNGEDHEIVDEAGRKALDNAVGNIEFALDSIIAIQNEMIGGGQT